MRQASRLGRIVRGAFAPRAASPGTDGSGAPSRRRRALVALGLATLATLLLAAPALAAGDANEASCPAATESSPGFRAALPDCRAYELVSPAFKFGAAVKPGIENKLLDGSHLIGVSRGAFAGTGSDPGTMGAEYVFGRDEAAGWAATPMSPPATEFSGSGGLSVVGALLDTTHDFSRALIGADPTGSTPGSIESKPINPRFYIRQPNPSEASCPAGAIALAAACLLEVGPAVPPATVEAWTDEVEYFGRGAERPRITYRGASPDLKQVLFSTQAPNGGETNWLWPGDATVYHESLYQSPASGGSEPKLVGVKNEGPLASDTEAELISQCGADLGSLESGTTHNAIAAQGNVVFFTAREGGCYGGGTGPKVNELYARIGGSATLAISEPSLLVPGRDCTGVCREDENEENGHERSEGIFVGASEDGSKVFFLTSQPLLNSDEGGTGAGQDLYEAELEGGAIEKLIQVSHNDVNAGEAAEVQGVLRTSEEGTRVYFVAHGVLAGNQDAKGESALAGADNLYVYEPDPATPGQFKTVFIATLSGSDEYDWGAGSGGGGGGQVEVTPRTPTSTDGRFLVLASRGDLTPDTTAGEGVGQLYRFDAQQESLVRVSIDENFVNTAEESEFFREQESEFNLESSSLGTRSLAGPQPVAISSDGAYVFFQSGTALTPRALNKQLAGCSYEEGGECYSPIHANNVYEYHEGHVYLISDGQDRHAAEGGSAVNLIGASASGQDVYFATADPLVPQDTDTQQDIYDARIGGGFPAPPLPIQCSGDACQGQPSAAPPGPSPATSTFTGPGSESQKHHKRRRHHHRHHRRSHRRAGRDRRGIR